MTHSQGGGPADHQDEQASADPNAGQPAQGGGDASGEAEATEAQSPAAVSGDEPAADDAA